MKLKNLEVLAFDCQATSSNPGTGSLLEMGWMKTRAKDVFDLEQMERKSENYLIKPPDEIPIPPRVLKITGIELDEFQRAVTRRTAWQRLKRAARETAEHNRQSLCHVVIHFSRYEEPFLKHLHETYSSSGKFPFHILCTHDLVKRLLPGLPRKGLRAVTGYFGQSLSVHRRSSHHVRATAFIWHHLVSTLEDGYGIETTKDLKEWLAQTPYVPNLKNMREYPMDRELRLSLPEGPGIYKLYRANGDILYIGKAKSLKRRVNSYFQKRSRHSEHILEMLSQARHITTEATETAFEAALRESDEIKKLSPPYNIALREREREVVFFSKDLKSYKESPSRTHPIGPFSTPLLMTSLAKMRELLNKNQTQRMKSSVIEEILGSPPEYAPDEECFFQGFRMFREEFIDPGKGQFSLNSFFKLGSLFWKERLDELAALEPANEEGSDEEDDTDSESEAEETTPGIPSWSPEKVARAFKSLIRTGAHQARRARWFCRLSESTVTWNDKIRKSKEKHIIIFERGRIHSLDRLERIVENPLPPGFDKSNFERQTNMDLPSYDRMRILTTEMKRLLDEKRGIEVCFGPKITLKEEQLQRILKWV